MKGMKNIMKNILAIGAHPDDIEIGCAGTLSKLSDEGKNIYLLVLTKGENWENKTCTERLKEQELSVKLIGAKKLFYANFEDGKVVNSSEAIDLVTTIIQEYGIDTILTQSQYDTHQDHIQTYNISKSASHKCDNFITYESLTSKFFIPNFFVEICSYIDKKEEIINSFESQTKKYNKRNQDLVIITRCKDNINGMKINTKYAEGLCIEKMTY